MLSLTTHWTVSPVLIVTAGETKAVVGKLVVWTVVVAAAEMAATRGPAASADSESIMPAEAPAPPGPHKQIELAPAGPVAPKSAVQARVEAGTKAQTDAATAAHNASEARDVPVCIRTPSRKIEMTRAINVAKLAHDCEG
jgi:hypothetical protein